MKKIGRYPFFSLSKKIENKLFYFNTITTVTIASTKREEEKIENHIKLNW